MDPYREKNAFAESGIQPRGYPGQVQQGYNPPLDVGSQCARPETAVEALTSRNRSNNSSFLELEKRLHNILNRIGYPQEPENASGPSPQPPKGSFHELGESVQHAASISERLHRLLSDLETYV